MAKKPVKSPVFNSFQHNCFQKKSPRRNKKACAGFTFSIIVTVPQALNLKNKPIHFLR